jgi:hypothetical protein
MRIANKNFGGVGFFFFLAVMGFELRVSHLQGSHSYHLSHSASLPIKILKYKNVIVAIKCIVKLQ